MNKLKLYKTYITLLFCDIINLPWEKWSDLRKESTDVFLDYKSYLENKDKPFPKYSTKWSRMAQDWIDEDNKN